VGVVVAGVGVLVLEEEELQPDSALSTSVPLRNRANNFFIREFSFLISL